MVPRLHLTHLTRDPVWIEAADSAGIPRIGVDIERLNKHQRQAMVRDARISDHELHDLLVIQAHATRAKPFARLNRPHSGTMAEIDQALQFGARVLMLPGFDTPQQVANFINHVAGRAEVILLLETRAATQQLESILAIPGIDELMVGLNDMSLQYDLPSPMAMALSPILESIAAQVQPTGIPFGFGGVARPERRDLPVDPDLLLARYAQLGATRAWIARSFTNDGMPPEHLAAAINQLQQRYEYWHLCDEDTRQKAVTTMRSTLATRHPFPK